MIVIVFGLPGSGRSFFAVRLANLINAIYINSDKVRMEMYQQKTYKYFISIIYSSGFYV